MEEADALATRAAIISKKLLAVGTTKELRQKYSNWNHVQLLLKSAPYSTDEEMAIVQDWVVRNVPGAQLERETLGGQIRFTIPNVSSTAGSTSQPTPLDDQGRVSNASVRLIQQIEKNKEALGIEYYSIGGATLERVFLSVVKKNNVTEEDELPKKQSFWRR
jgi:ATP-binding cassette, subfamily A (ABC1), member 3